ncbi:DUF4132 domain-containing protein, partial [Streptomyces sp. SID685]|nr:DUF4132 domain-containing protein [Streptomyces sp. SID685]
MATTADVGRAALVDAWAEQHGLPFAACAALRLLDLQVVHEHEADPRLARLRDSLTARCFSLFRGVDSPPEHEEARAELSAVNAIQGPVHPSVAVLPDPTTQDRREALDRVRELLADCDARTYEEAVARLRAHRDGFTRRVVTAYLAPTEADWVADCFADPAALPGADGSLSALLRCLPVTAAQIAMLTRHDRAPADPAEVATVADGAGVAVDELVIRSLDLWHKPYDKPTELRRALVEIPTDRAFARLLEGLEDKDVRPYVVRAAKRRPVRALRLLAHAATAGGPGSAAHSLLVSHIGAHPELTAGRLPALPAQAAETVRTILDPADGRLPDATDLPDLLTSPPWSRPRKAATRQPVLGLSAPDRAREAWLPGEREEWAATASPYLPWPWPESMTYEEKQLREGRLSDQVHLAAWYLELPEERILPLLDDWEPSSFDAREVLRAFVARYGLKAHTFLVRLAAREPQVAGPLLMPFVSTAIARTAADWLVRLKRSARTARDWLDRHGAQAAELLVPDAVGAPGAARRAAQAALLRIASR